MRRGRKMAWDTGQVEKLKELHAGKQPFSQMAKHLGCTRSTIAGKIRRLKITGDIDLESPNAEVKKPLPFYSEVKSLFEKGLSYSQIAKEIGKTRGAICAIARRQGLKRGENRIVSVKKKKIAAPAPFAPVREGASLDASHAPAMALTGGGDAAMHFNPSNVVKPSHTASLKERDCRWIENGMYCCAVKQDKSSYCPQHHARSYVKWSRSA